MYGYSVFTPYLLGSSYFLIWMPQPVCKHITKEVALNKYSAVQNGCAAKFTTETDLESNFDDRARVLHRTGVLYFDVRRPTSNKREQPETYYEYGMRGTEQKV